MEWGVQECRMYMEVPCMENPKLVCIVLRYGSKMEAVEDLHLDKPLESSVTES